MPPGGFGTHQFVTGQGAFPYTINFQNKADADIPASEVVITQTLDADVDLDTFQDTGAGKSSGKFTNGNDPRHN